MTTLKEFEEVLREQGMMMALAVLAKLRQRDRAKRSIAPARRVAGRKMTPDLARNVLELHGATDMTQQEIAFKLGVNQGRVNEVIKHGKWLSGEPGAPEAQARDKAVAKVARRSPDAVGASRRPRLAATPAGRGGRRRGVSPEPAQLSLDDL